MKLFIPSKDRACQLDLLLRSLDINAGGIPLETYVLHTCSTPDFREGYRVLANKPYAEHIHFVAEYNFQTQFKSLLLKWSWDFQENDFDNTLVMLLTDDCIWYRKIYKFPEWKYKPYFNNTDTLCFSYRLGLNTVVQNYATGELQPQLIIKGSPEKNHIISWDRRFGNIYSNYSYPLSWDGVIYRATDLFNWAKQIEFKNPREFEGRIVNQVFQQNNELPFRMYAPAHSAVVVSTNNCCQTPPMDAGFKYPYSLAELNERYLNDEIVDLNQIDFGNVNSCHEEFPFYFKPCIENQ